MIGPRAIVPGVAAALLLAACEAAPPADPVGERTPTFPRTSQGPSYPENRTVYVQNPDSRPVYVQTVTTTGPVVVGPSTVTIRFAGAVGDQVFRCGASYGGIGVTGSTITPADFRMYVSNVALIDESGVSVPMALVEDGTWQSRNVALLDFEDGTGPCAGGTPAVRDSITGNIPPGRYRGLVFTLGLPADQNVGPAGIALPPLNVPALMAAPVGGYRFLKVDMATSGQPLAGLPSPYPAPVYVAPGYVAPGYVAPGYVAPAPAYAYPGPSYTAGFPVHVAATAVTITFPSFDFGRDVVVADLRGLLATTNVDFNSPGTPAGCQSGPADPDCTGVYSRLGIAYAGAPPVQAFFRQATPPLLSGLTR
ncbi:MAG: MbnP family protein [Alphaproteobacteria bacterium]